MILGARGWSVMSRTDTVIVDDLVVGYVRESWDGAVWSCLNWVRAPIGKCSTRSGAEKIVLDNARHGAGFVGTPD